MIETKPVYRASGIYPCKKRLSAVRLGIEGAPEPSWLQTAAEEGHHHERLIKEQLEAEGLEVSREQEEFVLHGDDHDFQIVGHIDGWVKDVGWEGLLEIKTMSQFEFDRWMKDGWNGFPTYANQLTIYWHMTGAEKYLYIAKNRSSGYVRREILEEPPCDIDDILIHVDEVERWVQEHNRVMEAEYNPLSVDCKHFCPYPEVLGCITTIDLTDIQEDELKVAEQNWLRGDDMEKGGKALKDEAKALFEPYHAQHKALGETWRFGALNIVRRHISKKGHEVKASEYDEMRITRAKGE